MRGKPSLINWLCSDARNGKNLNPMACQTCESPCEYGKRWLESMSMALPKETRENPFYPKDLPDLRTTPHQIFKRYTLNKRAIKQ